ncbi:hypothetical protein WMY93_001080 [Mugilogobius chulae]|uniref:Uncharacterized protein n=1 Tax=Mugilogobius chulae TaxID=88201 RepID=A0AAW0Q3S3_9GOBI
MNATQSAVCVYMRKVGRVIAQPAESSSSDAKTEVEEKTETQGAQDENDSTEFILAVQDENDSTDEKTVEEPVPACNEEDQAEVASSDVQADTQVQEEERKPKKMMRRMLSLK